MDDYGRKWWETGKTIGIMLNSTFSLGVVQKVHLFSREFWNSQIMALWVDNHPCSWTGMIMAGNGWITGKTIGIMLKYHLFPRDYEKNAILGPPKLPSGLRPLGSFGGPRTASFPESLEKRWSFGPYCSSSVLVRGHNHQHNCWYAWKMTFLCVFK